MNTMKGLVQILLTTLLLCIVPAALFSFDWPIPNGRALTNFGLNDNGEAERGILFISDASVFPADAGELLFVGSNKTGRTFFQPLGNWVALQHQDSLIGIYGHLSDLGSNSIPSLAEKATPIAKAGVSGWANSPQLQFTVYDRKTSGYVNPQLLINMTDSRPPLIKQIILVSRDGQRVPLGQTKVVRQGSYRVYIDAADGADMFGNNQVAPYQFRLFMNGSLQGELELDLLSAKNGKLQVGLRKGQSTAQIYQVDGTYLIGEIQLNRGKALCEVIVTDTAGNEKSQTYQLMVE